MGRNLKLVGKSIAILAGGCVLGVILLTLAFLAPVNPENMQESYNIIEQEGWYPAMPILSKSLDTYFQSFLPGVLDDSTDALMLRIALETRESNPLKAGMDMLGYSYYWHGYAAVLRPLLYLFDYGEIRFLNCAGQLVLLFFLLLRLRSEKTDRTKSCILLTSYIILMPLAMPLSLQFSWVFYVAYGGTAFLLTRKEQFKKSANVYLVFLVLGILTSYLDLLTYPLYTWAIPLIWLLAFSEEGESAWHHLRKVICTGCFWLIGYAVMWASKWIVGGLILNRNIFETAMEEVFLRSGMEEGAQWGLAQRLEAMYMNWKHYEYKIYAILLGCWLLWIIYKSIRNGWKNNRKNPALLLIAFSSVVWYFVLSNHTLGHHFFTYRIWGITIVAMLILYEGSLCREKQRKNIRQIAATFGTWAVLTICSFGLSFLAREDVDVMNGPSAFEQIELKQGNVMEVSFTPTFPVITSLGVGIQSEATKGEYVVSLYDGETLLYTETVDLKKLAGKAFIELPVDWKLQAGKNYRFRGIVQNNDAPAFIHVTKGMEMPLNEYGEASIDGEGLGGQPLAGNTYRYRPLSRATLSFLTMSWMGLLAGVLLEVKQIVVRVFHRFIGKAGKV